MFALNMSNVSSPSIFPDQQQKQNDEPPTKKSRTEDSLIPEAIFLQKHQVSNRHSALTSILMTFDLLTLSSNRVTLHSISACPTCLRNLNGN